MKELIDFDKQFNEYMDEYAEKLLNEGKKPEEIEELIPEMYENWAREARKYFEDMSDESVVQMLGAYLDEGIAVPDILTDVITERKTCERGIYELFRQDRSEDDAILLMNLLSDINSTLPLDDYLRIVRSSEESELADAACEALKYATDVFDGEILEAYEDEYSADIREKLLYILIYGKKKIKSLAPKLIELMNDTERKAVVAGLMSYYGDDACLPILKKVKDDDSIDYIDYVEICDAIEALGGTVKRDREFNGDEYYELMHNGGIK